MKGDKGMKKLLVMAAMVAGVAMTPMSMAQAAGWSGCGVGVNAGYEIAKNDTGNIIADSFSPGGAALGGKLFCDMQADRFVGGVFADAMFSNATATASLGTLGVDTGINWHWTVGARGGFLITPNTLLYGLVGYTQVDFKSVDVSIGPTTMGFSLGNANGITLGGGAEFQFADKWSMNLEYRYTDLSNENIAALAGFGAMDSNMHEFRVGLNYKFGGRDSGVEYTPMK